MWATLNTLAEQRHEQADADLQKLQIEIKESSESGPADDVSTVIYTALMQMKPKETQTELYDGEHVWPHAPTEQSTRGLIMDMVEANRQAKAIELLLASSKDLPSAFWTSTTLHSSQGDPLKESASLSSLSLSDPALLVGRNAWQVVCHQLQTWAVRHLAVMLLSDISLAAVHANMIQQMAQSMVRSPSGPRPGEPQVGTASRAPSWWRLPGPETPHHAERLVGAVYHLAPCEVQAWDCLLTAFKHGLVVEGRDSHSTPQGWTPSSFLRRVARLEEQSQEVLQRLPGTLGEQQHNQHWAREVAELSHAVLPRTYLQMVGQKVLHQYCQQVPVWLSLPQLPPEHFISKLYIRPFMVAVQLALTSICKHPEGNLVPFLGGQQAAAGDRSRRGQLPSDSSPSKSATSGSGSGQRGPFSAIWGLCRDIRDFELGLLDPLEKHGPISRAKSLVMDAFSQASQDVLLPLTKDVVTVVTAELMANLKECSAGAVPVAWESWPSLEFELFLEAQDNATGRVTGLDFQRPVMVLDETNKLLASMANILHKVTSLLPVLQVPMSIALMDASQQYMDHLASIMTSAYCQPATVPSPLIIHLASATCLQRRLQSMKPALDLGARVDLYGHLLVKYSSLVTQSGELVRAFQQHIITTQVGVMHAHVISGVDATPWQSYRPALTSPEGPGPQVRVWRMDMMALAQDLGTVLGAKSTQMILAQVLVETASLLVGRYLSLSPSGQRLKAFLSDIIHLTTTMYMMTQPIKVDREGPPDEGASDLVPVTLAMPENTSSQLSQLCLQMCTRAGLLSCDVELLEKKLAEGEQEVGSMSGGLEAGPGDVSAENQSHLDGHVIAADDPWPDMAVVGLRGPTRTTRYEGTTVTCRGEVNNDSNGVPASSNAEPPCAPALCTESGAASSSSEASTPNCLGYNGVCPPPHLPWWWLSALVRELLGDNVPRVVAGRPGVNHGLGHQDDTAIHHNWELLLGGLAREATQEAAKAAGQLRHELHRVVPGLPMSQEELDSRRRMEILMNRLDHQGGNKEGAGHGDGMNPGAGGLCDGDLKGNKEGDPSIVTIG